MISEFCDRMLLLLLVESGGKGGTHAMGVRVLHLL